MNVGQFKTLLGVYFKNMFRSGYDTQKSKKSKGALRGKLGSGIGMVILAGVAAIYVAAITIPIAPAFAAAGIEASYLSMILTASQVIVLFYGLVLLLSVLFNSSDNEMLSGLPVSSQTIFFSKLVFVYLNELAFSLVLTMTGAVTFAISVGVSTGVAYPVAYYALALLASLVSPMLPLCIGCVVAIPVIYAVNFVKNRGALGGILLIALFAVFMVGYMLLANSVGSIEGEVVIEGQALTMITNVSGIVAPNYAFARLITYFSAKGSLLFDVLIVVGATAAELLLTYIIATLVYRRTLAMSFENGSGRKKAVDYRGAKPQSVVKTLMVGDFKRIIRDGGIALNCFIEVIFPPIMMLVFGFSSGAMSDALATAGLPYVYDMILLAVTFLFIGAMAISVNFIAYSAISREGEHFAVLKTLPVHPADIVKSKVLLSSLVFAVTSLLSGISLAVFCKLNLVFSILTVLLFCIVGDAVSHLLVSFDVKRPTLHYENLPQALKNNSNSLLSLLTGFVIAIVFIAVLGVAVLMMYVLRLDAIASLGIMWSVLFILAIIMDVIFRKMLYKDITQKFQNIEF